MGVSSLAGAVPLATLNYQCGVPPGAIVPDAWHHQMIYGVGPRGMDPICKAILDSKTVQGASKQWWSFEVTIMVKLPVIGELLALCLATAGVEATTQG